MKIFRYLSILFIAFVFFGSTGANVFIHHCIEEGDSLSFIAKEHNCCERVSVISCCNINDEKDDCCSDEMKTFKTNYDFFHEKDNLKFSFNKLLYFNKLKPIATHFRLVELLISLYDPPPIPYQSNILVYNQVFRI